MNAKPLGKSFLEKANGFNGNRTKRIWYWFFEFVQAVFARKCLGKKSNKTNDFR